MKMTSTQSASLNNTYKPWAINMLAKYAYFQGTLQIMPLINDASFRHYFRIYSKNHSWILVDSPPDKTNNWQLIKLSKWLRSQNIQVPDIIAYDLRKGLLLVTDFGDRLYFRTLNDKNADLLYTAAIDTLTQLHNCNPLTYKPNQKNHHKALQPIQLPVFSKRLMKIEYRLFTDWFLIQYLKIKLTTDEENTLRQAYTYLENTIFEQPYVCIHRDYHSKNLCNIDPIENKITVGMLDFQDALWGPITYDLVSLLRDAYIDWPTDRITRWLKYAYLTFQSADLLPGSVNHPTFKRWFDLTGLQRHLKIMGNFARLAIRDNKPDYLAHLPRIYQYLLNTTHQYYALHPLRQLLVNRLSKAMQSVSP